MIASQLDRLKEVDPKTWERIARGLPIKPHGQYLTLDQDGRMTSHQIREAYIPFDELLPEVACAWLQAVLQDACEARGWDWQVWRQQRHWKGSGEYAATTGPVGRNAASGDSPAEALLRCYLGAIG